MKVELWPIDKPIPYARNARKISDIAIDKVAGSIKEFGWRQPIVVDTESVVVVGHTRLLAAKKLGLKQVPIHVATDLTPAQVKAYRLMDNRSHEEAEWDMEMLGVEMFDLKGLGLDLSLTGFDEDELAGLLVEKTEGLAPEDEVPPVPKEPVSRPGDLWLLGNHRVLCGDATKAEDVGRLLGSAKPALMVTDPPYGVEYEPEWREEVDGSPNHALGKVSNDDRCDWSEAWRLFPGDVVYVWHAGIFAGEVAASLHNCGFEIRAQIVWAKQHFAMSRGAYHWQHEPCWYAVRKGRQSRWHGDRKQSTLWQVANMNPFGGDATEKTGHGTQKPVECMRRPIVNHTIAGEAVYEPFCGSGTTVIACEKEARACYALELESAYCDVIIERWQKFAGKKGTLARDGRAFEELREERLAKAA